MTSGKRTETERGGVDLANKEADSHWLKKNGISVLLMSIVTVASNLTLTKHQFSVFFPSFWLLFDLLKGTSNVSQGPAI